MEFEKNCAQGKCVNNTTGCPKNYCYMKLGPSYLAQYEADCATRAADPAQAEQASDERQLFEAWVTAGGRGHLLELDHPHLWYKDLTITAWWTAWQARAALQGAHKRTTDDWDMLVMELSTAQAKIEDLELILEGFGDSAKAEGYRRLNAQIEAALQGAQPVIDALQKYAHHQNCDLLKPSVIGEGDDRMLVPRMCDCKDQRAQLSPEPVKYEIRMRPMWEKEGTCWSVWTECSAESAADYLRWPIYNDWQHEVRVLYAASQPSAPSQTEE